MPVNEPERNQLGHSLPLSLLEWFIFNSRYALVVIYVAGIALNLVFAARFIRDGILFTPDIWNQSLDKDTITMLSVLDAAMVANVVYLILAGSYTVYVKPKVSDLTFTKAAHRPLALQHLTPGTLKEKMASSLIGVFSVNLLQALINVGTSSGVSTRAAIIKVGIHLTLIVGFVAFATMNRADEKAEREAEAASKPTDYDTHGGA